jgi:hypothetical protein
MSSLVDSPFFVLLLSLPAQCLAAYVGDLCRRRGRPPERGRAQGLRYRPNGGSHALSADYWVQLFDGRGTLRSAQEMRRNRSERHWNCVRSRRFAPLRRGKGGTSVTAKVPRSTRRVLPHSGRAPDQADQLRHGKTAGRPLVDRVESCGRAANAGDGPRGRRHQRCAELARVYASSLVEPHAHRGLGPDGVDRTLSCNFLVGYGAGRFVRSQAQAGNSKPIRASMAHVFKTAGRASMPW